MVIFVHLLRRVKVSKLDGEASISLLWNNDDIFWLDITMGDHVTDIISSRMDVCYSIKDIMDDIVNIFCMQQPLAQWLHLLCWLNDIP